VKTQLDAHALQLGPDAIGLQHGHTHGFAQAPRAFGLAATRTDRNEPDPEANQEGRKREYRNAH
jgi:hypothetical protein